MDAPGDDRLGYTPFAKHLAESICRISARDGLVIAIYGPWGSGKTSLLNLVRYYLRQQSDPEELALVFFNPWWFSGHEDLTRRFFNQLQAHFSARQIASLGDKVALYKPLRVFLSHAQKSERIPQLNKSFGLRKLRSHLANLADLVSETPIPYASWGKTAAKFIREKTKDVTELKKAIADALASQGQRVLVIIDDIDRLTAEEIRQLFRVIKAVADFPNVIYLLAFDKQVAIKAIEQIQDIPGREYLEKIVQVPFELPLPDKTSLRRLLFEKLDMIIARTAQEQFDSTHWNNVYLDGIDHFIDTPRDIVRLTNTLSITYPAVQGEVNAVDFIAIEVLRVFCHLAYDMIRKNPDEFAGHSDSGTSLHQRDTELNAFHEAWITQVLEVDREPVKKLLTRLFPKLQVCWGSRAHYGPDWESTWRKQLRVCSPEKIPIYFRLAVPEGGFSVAEMQAILASTSDAETFGRKLIEFANQQRPDNSTRVSAFLERLEDY